MDTLERGAVFMKTLEEIQRMQDFDGGEVTMVSVCWVIKRSDTDQSIGQVANKDADLPELVDLYYNISRNLEDEIVDRQR